MFKAIETIALLSAILSSAFLFSGCEINEGDVAAAREDVVEEQNETQQARELAEREISQKESELKDARHMAMQPDVDENQTDVADKERELERTRQKHEEKVRDEVRETEKAKAKAATLERDLAAKKARDSYAADIDLKVDSADQRIATMREQLTGLEGVARQELETDIELLEVKRENLSDELTALRGAEVMAWESYKKKVEQAIERLENDDNVEDK